MSDVFPLSGISGLSFESPFLTPFLFVCLVLLHFLSCDFSSYFSNGPFSCLFSRKFSNIFREELVFFVWLLLAAIWHWYLPLCIYVIFIVSVHSFFFFNLVLIN